MLTVATLTLMLTLALCNPAFGLVNGDKIEVWPTALNLISRINVLFCENRSDERRAMRICRMQSVIIRNSV